MRYFIATLLHDEPKWRIEALRDELAQRFGVKEALKIPPHVTLVPPFETEEIEPLLPVLKSIADEKKAFTVPVPRFGHFDDRVWFVDITPTPELISLQQKVEQAVRTSVHLSTPERPPRETHFHINLASKDLTPATFRAIKTFLTKEPLPFSELTIDNITLLRHEAHAWTEVVRQSFSIRDFLIAFQDREVFGSLD